MTTDTFEQFFQTTTRLKQDLIDIDNLAKKVSAAIIRLDAKTDQKINRAIKKNQSFDSDGQGDPGKTKTLRLSKRDLEGQHNALMHQWRSKLGELNNYRYGEYQYFNHLYEKTEKVRLESLEQD